MNTGQCLRMKNLREGENQNFEKSRGGGQKGGKFSGGGKGIGLGFHLNRNSGMRREFCTLRQCS